MLWTYLVKKTIVGKYYNKLRDRKFRILPKEINLRKLFNEYSDNSTVHGVRYAVESKTLLERIWWILVIISSIFVCIFFILNIHNKWSRSPVIVSFSSKPTPVVEVPLPAMTICPQVKNQNSLFNFSTLLDDVKNGTIIDDHYRSAEYSNLHELLHILCPRSEILRDHLPKTREYLDMNIYDSIKNLAPPKEETIVACGPDDSLTRNCTKLLQRVITSRGLCYTFNALTPYQLYRDDVLHSMSGIRSANDEDIPEFTWTLEDGYKQPVVDPDIYPINSLGGILGKPFMFIFSVLKDDLTAECENFQGFKIFLHPQNEIPLHTSHFIKAPIGNDLKISAMPKLVVTTDEVLSYSPDQRGCFFSREKYLRFFKEYTEINCFMECIANYTMKMCGCTAFIYPRLRTSKICGLAKNVCVKAAEDALVREAFLRTEGKDPCDCKPGCVSISYTIESYYSPAENLAQLYKKLNISNIENYQTSIASVIYSESLFTRIRRREFFSRTDVVANCGGILGLFLGISIISFAEFFYYLTIRPLIIYREKRSNETKVHPVIAIKDSAKMVMVKEHTDIQNQHTLNVKEQLNNKFVLNDFERPQNEFIY